MKIHSFNKHLPLCQALFKEPELITEENDDPCLGRAHILARQHPYPAIFLSEHSNQSVKKYWKHSSENLCAMHGL